MSNQEVALRIAASIILGGIIGLERQFKQRPAGFKTHILVCVGSATIMVLSEYMFRKYYAEFGLLTDPSRLGAQVISGVGFLGAGTIIHHGQNVRGLTTAASLWVVAAIGLAAGAGYFFLAGLVAVSIYIILFIFNKIYNKFTSHSDVSSLQIKLLNKAKAIGAINLMLAKNNIKILDMNYINPSLDDEMEHVAEIIYLHLVLKMNEDISIAALSKSIQGINGVIEVENA